MRYMVLSVLVGTVAVAVPIISYTQLEKIGASSHEERKAMFDQALKIFDLKDPGKNQLMMALAALAYVSATRQEWPYRKRIATQQYQDKKQTPEVSIFREGLARLIHKCFRFCRFLDFVLGILNPKNHAICKNVQ